MASYPQCITDISIHALLAESDACLKLLAMFILISIHALLAESDAPWPARLASRAYFYPRSPCGERQPPVQAHRQKTVFLSTLSLRRATPVREIIQWEGIFLSTLSLRRATADRVAFQLGVLISIHALLAESDECVCGRNGTPQNFYPRSPCGERPAGDNHRAVLNLISIHALLAESDPSLFPARMSCA